MHLHAMDLSHAPIFHLETISFTKGAGRDRFNGQNVFDTSLIDNQNRFSAFATFAGVAGSPGLSKPFVAATRVFHAGHRVVSIDLAARCWEITFPAVVICCNGRFENAVFQCSGGRCQ